MKGCDAMIIPQTWISLVNIILLAWLALALLMGYRQGFLLQLYNLLAMLVALFVAWLFAPAFAKMWVIFRPDLGQLNQFIDIQELMTQQINTFIWFILLFIAMSLIIALLRPVIKAIGKLPVLKFFNRIAGALFGFLKWTIQVFIVILLLSLPIFANGEQVINESWLHLAKSASVTAFSYLEKPLNENRIIQQLLSGEALTDLDIATLRQWLKDKGLSDQAIIEFLEGLQQNYE